MSKSYVIYKDVAPMAALDASPAATGAADYSQPALLIDGTDTGKARTLELNQWLLDGAHTELDKTRVALWSAAISGADHALADPAVIDITFTEQHSSVGISLEFDAAGGNFVRLLHIEWYQGETLLDAADFQPDATTYFCARQVLAWDRIVITLLETSLPYRRAKVNRVIFGLDRRFDMREIRAAKIILQGALLSSELPISTMDLSLDSKTDIAFLFQLKQPLEVWNDDAMLGVFYIDGHMRKSGALYDLDCYDAIGVLDEMLFDGGVYSARSALSLLQDIVHPWFELDTSVEDVQLTGAILPGTRREAMQQVLFAAGWLCATDGGYALRIFNTDEVLAEIGRGRTYTGVSSELAAITTEVRVTAHSYAQDSNGSIEIDGARYKDTETVYTVTNPNVTANDKQSVVKVTDATLVSPAIGQTVAQRVYDFYAMRQTDSAKIVWRGERVADYVSLPTAWGSTHAGHIQKMTINLSNTVAADVETLAVPG